MNHRTFSAKPVEAQAARVWWVVDASKVKLTGQKLDQKHYYHHSGSPGGIRSESYRHLLERKPEFAIEKAVKGMLPKNVLGRQLMTKLKVYNTPDHPHA